MRLVLAGGPGGASIGTPTSSANVRIARGLRRLPSSAESRCASFMTASGVAIIVNGVGLRLGDMDCNADTDVDDGTPGFPIIRGADRLVKFTASGAPLI